MLATYMIMRSQFQMQIICENRYHVQRLQLTISKSLETLLGSRLL